MKVPRLHSDGPTAPLVKSNAALPLACVLANY